MLTEVTRLVNRTDSGKFKKACVNARSLPLQLHCLLTKGIKCWQQSQILYQEIVDWSNLLWGFLNIASKKPGAKVIFKLMWENAFLMLAQAGSQKENKAQVLGLSGSLD